MKLTKKILEQLIKEELTGDTVLFKISKKDKKRLAKKIDLELKTNPDFKLKTKKFSRFLKSLPGFGRLLTNVVDLPRFMTKLDQVYKKQGIGPAMMEVSKFIMGFAPVVGELMLISDLADRYQDEKLKLYTRMYLNKNLPTITGIRPEKGPPRLTPLQNPRYGTNPLDRLKVPFPRVPPELLNQLIKEEGDNETMDETKELLKKLVGGIALEDPCLKKQKTMPLFKNIMKSLYKLPAKDLTYVENSLYDMTEFTKDIINYAKKSIIENVEVYEEVEQTFEDVKRGDFSSEAAQDMRDNIETGRMTVKDYLELQEDMLSKINSSRKAIAEYKCRVTIFNKISKIAAELSGDMYQDQSDKQKVSGELDYSLTAIRDKKGNVKQYQGSVYSIPFIITPDAIFYDGKKIGKTLADLDKYHPIRRVMKKTIIRESNTKLTKLRLEQLIKEELSRLTEGRKQYLCYQWWRDLEANEPGRYESLGRQMRAAFDNVDNYDPTIAQMNGWLDRFSDCPINPSVVDVIDVDKPQ